VETTGRSVDEAKDAALDQLGVEEADAEFEVVADARSGLFGRLRQEARVRARVRPTTPPAKAERRDRKRRTSTTAASGASAAGGGEEPVRRERAKAATGSGESSGRQGTRGRPVSTNEPNGSTRRFVPDEDASPAEAGEVTSAFLGGLLEAFGADGTPSAVEIDESTVEVRVEGDDLGLLVGPKGATLAAVQELSRTVLSRSDGAGRGVRLHVDVAGYRARRREALEKFTRSVADSVLDSGQAAALEPMNAADRKVVHDTGNSIAGIATASEGEEPRRRVVLHPASGAGHTPSSEDEADSDD